MARLPVSSSVPGVPCAGFPEQDIGGARPVTPVDRRWSSRVSAPAPGPSSGLRALDTWVAGCDRLGREVGAAPPAFGQRTGEWRDRMALTTQRDDAELAAGLARWLGRDQGRSDVTIMSLDRPSAGYSSETVLVEIEWSEQGVRQGTSLVIRMAPAEAGTFADYDVVPQWEAQVAAAAAGVPVADPAVETDTQWLGAPFLVMPRVSGHIIGELPHRDRWLGGLGPSDRGRLYRSFIVTMSTVHRADAGRAVDVPHRDNAAEMDFWDEYLMWSSDGSPVPVLVSALQWCRRHRPATEPDPVLLWGDARFENVVFGDDLDPLAVLDWDMTSIGAPQHDLAWFTSLDLIVEPPPGCTARRIPGQGRDHQAVRVGAPSARSRDLEWYETLAMVRSTAVMTRIGYLRQRAGEPLLLPIEDNPILDIVKSRIG